MLPILPPWLGHSWAAAALLLAAMRPGPRCGATHVTSAADGSEGPLLSHLCATRPSTHGGVRVFLTREMGAALGHGRARGMGLVLALAMTDLAGLRGL